jgi:hypothetical protein
MFWKRGEDIEIHGKKYAVSNASNIDHYNCRGLLNTIFQQVFEVSAIEDLNVDSYINWRKDAIKNLK